MYKLIAVVLALMTLFVSDALPVDMGRRDMWIRDSEGSHTGRGGEHLGSDGKLRRFLAFSSSDVSTLKLTTIEPSSFGSFSSTSRTLLSVNTDPFILGKINSVDDEPFIRDFSFISSTNGTLFLVVNWRIQDTGYPVIIDNGVHVYQYRPNDSSCASSGGWHLRWQMHSYNNNDPNRYSAAWFYEAHATRNATQDGISLFLPGEAQPIPGNYVPGVWVFPISGSASCESSFSSQQLKISNYGFGQTTSSVWTFPMGSAAFYDPTSGRIKYVYRTANDYKIWTPGVGTATMLTGADGGIEVHPVEFQGLAPKILYCLQSTNGIHVYDCASGVTSTFAINPDYHTNTNEFIHEAFGFPSGEITLLCASLDNEEIIGYTFHPDTETNPSGSSVPRWDRKSTSLFVEKQQLLGNGSILELAPWYVYGFQASQNWATGGIQIAYPVINAYPNATPDLFLLQRYTTKSSLHAAATTSLSRPSTECTGFSVAPDWSSAPSSTTSADKYYKLTTSFNGPTGFPAGASWIAPRVVEGNFRTASQIFYLNYLYQSQPGINQQSIYFRGLLGTEDLRSMIGVLGTPGTSLYLDNIALNVQEVGRQEQDTNLPSWFWTFSGSTMDQALVYNPYFNEDCATLPNNRWILPNECSKQLLALNPCNQGDPASYSTSWSNGTVVGNGAGQIEVRLADGIQQSFRSPRLSGIVADRAYLVSLRYYMWPLVPSESIRTIPTVTVRLISPDWSYISMDSITGGYNDGDVANQYATTDSVYMTKSFLVTAAAAPPAGSLPGTADIYIDITSPAEATAEDRWNHQWMFALDEVTVYPLKK